MKLIAVLLVLVITVSLGNFVLAGFELDRFMGKWNILYLSNDEANKPFIPVYSSDKSVTLNLINATHLNATWARLEAFGTWHRTVGIGEIVNASTPWVFTFTIGANSIENIRVFYTDYDNYSIIFDPENENKIGVLGRTTEISDSTAAGLFAEIQKRFGKSPDHFDKIRHGQLPFNFLPFNLPFIG